MYYKLGQVLQIRAIITNWDIVIVWQLQTESPKEITVGEQGAKHILSRKKVFNTEKEKFLNFFGLIFIANLRVISNKILGSIQSLRQRRFTVLINTFSRSHVSYCPFVWMWYGRILHNRIFRLHLQEETFIISMFACWRQICFYSQWQFGISSYCIM